MACNEFCGGANYYIEQEILKYYLTEPKNQKEEKLDSDNENDKDEKNNIAAPSELADNNKPTQNYFDTVKIEGDGNCLFKAILEALNINQSKHKTLREYTAKAIETKEWDQGVLEAIGIRNPHELADKVRTPNTFVGETAISPLAEKLQITVAIYLKDTTKQWIKENDTGQHEIIYLEYLQGKYANSYLEGHYNTLKPKTQQELLSTQRVLKELQQIECENAKNQQNKLSIQNKINILVWNIQSIQSNKNYTKKQFLIQLLLENDIHIALIQETFLGQDDKLYIKGFKIFRSGGISYRKGVAILVSNTLIWNN